MDVFLCGVWLRLLHIDGIDSNPELGVSWELVCFHDDKRCYGCWAIHRWWHESREAEELMLWLWKRHPKTMDEIDLEAVISSTLTGYGVTDPVEAAWFAMALRELLPIWIAKRVIR